jgi:hypothetical protein
MITMDELLLLGLLNSKLRVPHFQGLIDRKKRQLVGFENQQKYNRFLKQHKELEVVDPEKCLFILTLCSRTMNKDMSYIYRTYMPEDIPKKWEHCAEAYSDFLEQLDSEWIYQPEAMHERFSTFCKYL